MLHFRLRTMLIGIAVLAVPLAWVGFSLRWIRERRTALECDGVSAATDQHVRHVEAPGYLWLLGEEGIVRLHYGPGFGGSPGKLSELFPESKVSGPNDPLLSIRLPGSNTKIEIVETEERLSP